MCHRLALNTCPEPPVQPGYSTRAGITIGDKLEVNPIQIQLYADRFDGAGWY